jgi:hypothetical protein
MAQVKNIAFSIQITPVSVVFTDDVDAAILNYLNKSVPICNKGVLITKFRQIVNRTVCKINASLAGEIIVDLTVEIDCIQYTSGTLLVGKVTQLVDSSTLVIENDNFSAFINDFPINIALGTRIPFYSLNCYYAVGKPKVSIQGCHYVPLVDNNIYKITTVVKNVLAISDVDKQLKDIEKKYTKASKFFKDMLYNKVKVKSITHFDQFTNLKEGAMVSRIKMYGVPGFSLENKSVSYNEVTGDYVANLYITNYINEISNLCILIEEYNSDYLSINNIWELYKSFK